MNETPSQALAESALDVKERLAAKRAGLPAERAALFAHYLTDTGLAELCAPIRSADYRLETPEGAALPVVAWLLERGDPVTSEFFEFYVTDRGHHHRSIGAFTVTSGMSHINYGALRHLPDIAPRPILLITGEQAHSRYFSDTVHEQATGPKKLVVVPGARHIDLYDRTDLIPFGELEEFFTENLA